MTDSHDLEAGSSGGAQLLINLVFEASSALVEGDSIEGRVYWHVVELVLKASSPFDSEVRDLAGGVVNSPGDSVTGDALDERLTDL